MPTISPRPIVRLMSWILGGDERPVTSHTACLPCIRRTVALGVDAIDLAPEHQLDEARLGHLLDRAAADVDTAAKDGGPVAEVLDLLEPVRDEHRDPARLRELAHLREEPADLLGQQCRRRLVENEHCGLADHGLADLDDLSLGQAELAYGAADIDALDAELMQRGCGLMP